MEFFLKKNIFYEQPTQFIFEGGLKHKYFFLAVPLACYLLC